MCHVGTWTLGVRLQGSGFRLVLALRAFMCSSPMILGSGLGDVITQQLIAGKNFLSSRVTATYWVAVKELKLSYYIGEILGFATYTHYGNLV